MHLTDKGKHFLVRGFVLLLVVAGFFGLRQAAAKGYGKSFLPGFLVPKVELESFGNATLPTGTAATFVGLPSRSVASIPGAPHVRVQFWAWNAQLGCLYANGGPITTENSLVAKQGIIVSIKRQDDNNQLMAELTALAKAMSKGDNDPADGSQFIGIMGDGSGQFFAALNKELERAYGPDYRAEVVGSCGYSRGEDKLMGPKEWKDNPQSLKGSLIAGVVRDGDWNIAMRYAGDNNISNNPDETTYDPELINWVNTSSFTDAAEKFVQNYCEDRKVVHNGKPTGETKHVCVQGAVTWTPGDVTMAKNKGGVVSVVSTKEYANQMPHVIIGIHKWDQAHRATVEKMLTAFLQGGDQILTFPQALDRAAEISQDINQEKGADAGYWKKYYLGVRENDKLGNPVDLGGSKANNLADNLVLFGIAPGTSPNTSRFHATYTVFGNLASKMYPKLMPTLPSEDSILDVSYLRDISTTVTTKAETQNYTPTDSLSNVVGRRNISINFETGKSALTSSGEQQMSDLLNTLTINNLNIEVHGYTDNVGDPSRNLQLSEDRALTIKNWLESKSPTNFPAGRVVIKAHGQNNPIASNATAEGRAQNRRVTIVIGR